jgi:site-specific DNA recombinase
VLEGEISRLVDAVATVGISPAITQRLQAAEAERAKLQAEVQTSAPPAEVGQLVDRVAAKFKQTLMQLQAALEQQDDRERTRHILAEIIGPVKAVWEGGETFAEFEEPAERLLLAAVGESLNVVAGAGFEPTTFGL